MLALGQELDVAVLKVEPGEKGRARSASSLKALANDPWRDATAKLGEGSRVKGTVTRLQPFGAFVEIAPGVEGLVHISELGAGRRINHPKEVVSVGQQVEATVLAVDHEQAPAVAVDGRVDDASPEEIAQARRLGRRRLGTFGEREDQAAPRATAGGQPSTFGRDTRSRAAPASRAVPAKPTKNHPEQRSRAPQSSHTLARYRAAGEAAVRSGRTRSRRAGR